MNFILLTTTKCGLNLAKGLTKAGHSIKHIGIGTSEKGKPVGSLNTSDIVDYFDDTIGSTEIDINREEDIKKLLEGKDFDFIATSWPRIFSEGIISCCKSKVIGTHPTPLPYGRGRHPLHWMKVLGIRRSKLSAFWIDKGVDTGKVIATVKYRTKKGNNVIDDLLIVEDKHLKLGIKTGNNIKKHISGQIQKEVGTSWRKRNSIDSHIDWRMSADSIRDHIKSINTPWPQATFRTNCGREGRVSWSKKAHLALLNRHNKWSQLGDILDERDLTDGTCSILVRCYGGATWITYKKHEQLENQKRV